MANLALLERMKEQLFPHVLTPKNLANNFGGFRELVKHLEQIDPYVDVEPTCALEFINLLNSVHGWLLQSSGNANHLLEPLGRLNHICIVSYAHFKQKESSIQPIPTTSQQLVPSPKTKIDDADADKQKTTIGIITVLKHEFMPMEEVLTHSREREYQFAGRGYQFRIGEITSKFGGTHTVAVHQCNMGENSASTRATAMLALFPNIDIVFMTGIAGGIPFPVPPARSAEKHVRLGDIVISNIHGVVQYDFVKESQTFKEVRSSPIRPSSEWLDVVKKLEAGIEKSDFPWESILVDFLKKHTSYVRPSPDKDVLYGSDENSSIVPHPDDEHRREGQPRVFLGRIASSNTLLKNPFLRDRLRDEHDARAVEMETSGVADATWDHGKGYMAVRGICDYCDDHKNNIWQRYAGACAAAFTRALIEAKAPKSIS